MKDTKTSESTKKKAVLRKGMTDECVLQTAATALKFHRPLSDRLYRKAKQLGLHPGFWASLLGDASR